MTHANGATGSGLVVLLAEDDENDVVQIRRALERLGVVDQLVVVSDGEDTVSYLLGDGRYADRRSYPFPGMVFLDYKMPLLSGLGVLCWLRSEPRFEHLPVVVLSDACSLAQAETIARLKAACCPKNAATGQMMDAIGQSIRRALDGMTEGMPRYESSRSFEATRFRSTPPGREGADLQPAEALAGHGSRLGTKK